VLKAFESGTSIVSVIACEEGNCCFVEGSTRCSRRLEYVRFILREIGLGDQRLLLFHLPGSAAEDLASSADRPLPANHTVSLDEQIAGICASLMQRLHCHPRSPLLDSIPDSRNEGSGQGGDIPTDIFHDE
jgi:hypothetical protein